jgi:hypothetical protein
MTCPSGAVQVFAQRVGDWLLTVTPSHHFLGFDKSLCGHRSRGGHQVTLPKISGSAVGGGIDHGYVAFRRIASVGTLRPEPGCGRRFDSERREERLDRRSDRVKGRELVIRGSGSSEIAGEHEGDGFVHDGGVRAHT